MHTEHFCCWDLSNCCQWKLWKLPWYFKCLFYLMLFCPKRGSKPCISDHRITAALTLKQMFYLYLTSNSLYLYSWSCTRTLTMAIPTTRNWSCICFLCETFKSYIVTMQHFYMFNNKYRLLVLISQCVYNLWHMLSSSGFRKPLDGFSQTKGL